MTNFDLFTKEQDFAPFAQPAVSAERIYAIDPAACVLNCRRAMEAAVKWMYSVDGDLKLPWDDKLVSLMSTDEFRDVVDDNLLRRMHFIRKLGNTAAHAGSKVTREQAALCLENLYIFLDFVAYCYGENYEERAFDPALLNGIQASEAPHQSASLTASPRGSRGYGGDEGERIATAPSEPRNDDKTRYTSPSSRGRNIQRTVRDPSCP